ncbi:phosphoglycerate kinase [Candidatus Woesearchaeota archaeon]|nr:phosphoglycerate kinase [Candidatus Woesearchaeota archaeon]
MRINHLEQAPIKGKTVLVRVDYNVPIRKGEVEDNYKIKASLETIRFLIRNDCKIVLATHLGRPEGKFNLEYSTRPLVKELKKLLPNIKISYLENCIGKDILARIEKGVNREIFLLENLRFYKEEENNDELFAHSLAALADVYVNDAFGVSHRKHASVYAITEFLPSYAGFLLEKEVDNLSKALNARKPAVWIMGGGKLDKIELVEQALKKADYILIGGALAFAFMKAKGIPIGMSKTDVESVHSARRILERKEARKMILPIDFLATEKMVYSANVKIVKYNEIDNKSICLDLGPETVKLFKQYLRKAHTIVWNGPLGYYEWAVFAYATKEIGRVLGNLTAVSIVGGGETADAMIKFKLEHKVTHVSTGGGASLEFLAGKKLPGIEALKRGFRK